MANGMKSGSGDDPFADMDDEEEDQDDQRDEEREGVDTSFDDVQTDDNSQGSEPSGGTGLPWIYERGGIDDGRKTRQIHLQEESLRRESSAKSELETILGETAKKGDIREAALLVGLDHLDEVADKLREWGYDFE